MPVACSLTWRPGASACRGTVSGANPAVPQSGRLPLDERAITSYVGQTASNPTRKATIMRTRVICPCPRSAAILAGLLDSDGIPSVWVYVDGEPCVLTLGDYSDVAPHIDTVATLVRPEAN